ncbi:MAG: hypothetical protein WCZ88_17875 [Pigmentiphaga sp.]
MIANNFRSSSVRHLGTLAAAALFGALPLTVQAADDAASRFQAERAACSQIANEASRQACVREAGLPCKSGAAAPMASLSPPWNSSEPTPCAAVSVSRPTSARAA